MTAKAREPFVFNSRLHLNELTGVKATTLPELVQCLRTVNSASIYRHTHHFIEQHQYLAPEPTNDFAYWVSESLGDDSLGEQLAGIDVLAQPTISSIRKVLIGTIDRALRTRPRLKALTAPEGEEFVFLKSVSFVFPTPYRAADLVEFAECLRKVSLSSIYFHMFEAKLRLERPTNDFSYWLMDSLGERQLALRIAQLDPYSQSGETIRSSLLKILETRIKEAKEK